MSFPKNLEGITGSSSPGCPFLGNIGEFWRAQETEWKG